MKRESWSIILTAQQTAACGDATYTRRPQNSGRWNEFAVAVWYAETYRWWFFVGHTTKEIDEFDSIYLVQGLSERNEIR